MNGSKMQEIKTIQREREGWGFLQPETPRGNEKEGARGFHEDYLQLGWLGAPLLAGDPGDRGYSAGREQTRVSGRG